MLRFSLIQKSSVADSTIMTPGVSKSSDEADKRWLTLPDAYFPETDESTVLVHKDKSRAQAEQRLSPGLLILDAVQVFVDEYRLAPSRPGASSQLKVRREVDAERMLGDFLAIGIRAVGVRTEKKAYILSSRSDVGALQQQHTATSNVMSVSLSAHEFLANLERRRNQPLSANDIRKRDYMAQHRALWTNPELVDALFQTSAHAPGASTQNSLRNLSLDIVDCRRNDFLNPSSLAYADIGMQYLRAATIAPQRDISVPVAEAKAKDIFSDVLRETHERILTPVTWAALRSAAWLDA